jgi:hypothetical protein
MNKIESYIGSAGKLNGVGTLDYALLVDKSGVLFIQILNNIVPGTNTPGKHTKLLIRASDYLDKRFDPTEDNSISGLNLKTMKYETETNRNNNAFIKAILRHMFPEEKGLGLAS